MSGNDEHNSFWARVFAAGDSQPGEPACETRDRQRERFQSAQNLGIPTGRPVRERRRQAPPPSAGTRTVERGGASAGALRTLCVVTFIIMCLVLLISVALGAVSVAVAITTTVIGAVAMVIIVNFVIRD